MADRAQANGRIVLKSCFMKILIVTPIFPPEIGGPATYVSQLIKRLKDKHEFSVITFGKKTTPLEGVTITALKTKYKIGGLFLRQWSLWKALKKQIKNVDFVYAQGPFEVGVVTNLVAKKYLKPLLMKFVGDPLWEAARGAGRTEKFLDDYLQKPDSGFVDRLKLKLQKWSFRKATKIVVPSNYLKNVLTDYYQVPAHKITIIYNAIEIPQDLPSFSKPEKTHLITIGRLVKWKHIDEIITAISFLKNPHIHLDIVGEGPELKNLQKTVTNLALSGQVTFHGRLDHGKTLAMLAGANAFILNSSYEGLPHTVIESMLVKTPVIATRIKGTTEIAIENETAFLVNPRDPHDLARQIKNCLSNTAQRDEYVKNAYILASQNFNWETNLAALQKVWKF